MKLTTELLRKIIKEEINEIRGRFGDFGYRGKRRTSRSLIDYARNLLLYRPNEPGGMKAFPITRKQDGDFMRFFIEDEGRQIQIFPTSGGQKINRMGKAEDNGEEIDLIPADTSGNMRYGGRGHISFK